jgi:hypothetical protein
MKRYYHFVGKTLRDGLPIPADGEWLSVKGKLKMCSFGLHASAHVADAVCYAPGTTLCLVELDGEILEQDDKVCARKRKIIARFDATDLLRADARTSALSVIHLWKAPVIVKQYLETGDETIRAEAQKAAADADAAAAAAAAADAAAAANVGAYAASYAASYASYAASYAVYTAAAAAANAYAAAAARSKHREVSRARLQAAVDAQFVTMGVTP